MSTLFPPIHSHIRLSPDPDPDPDTDDPHEHLDTSLLKRTRRDQSSAGEEDERDAMVVRKKMSIQDHHDVDVDVDIDIDIDGDDETGTREDENERQQHLLIDVEGQVTSSICIDVSPTMNITSTTESAPLHFRTSSGPIPSPSADPRVMTPISTTYSAPASTTTSATTSPTSPTSAAVTTQPVPVPIPPTSDTHSDTSSDPPSEPSTPNSTDAAERQKAVSVLLDQESPSQHGTATRLGSPPGEFIIGAQARASIDRQRVSTRYTSHYRIQRAQRYTGAPSTDADIDDRIQQTTIQPKPAPAVSPKVGHEIAIQPIPVGRLSNPHSVIASGILSRRYNISPSPSPTTIEFTKEQVPAVRDSMSETPAPSPLSLQLQRKSRYSTSHPFRDDRPSEVDRFRYQPGNLRCTVYLPHDHTAFVQLEVERSTTAGRLIKHALDMYQQEHTTLHPDMTLPITEYRVFMAEEDGSVDTDCPALDDNVSIASTGCEAFALRRRAEKMSSFSTEERGVTRPGSKSSKGKGKGKGKGKASGQRTSSDPDPDVDDQPTESMHHRRTVFCCFGCGQ